MDLELGESLLGVRRRRLQGEIEELRIEKAFRGRKGFEIWLESLRG